MSVIRLENGLLVPDWDKFDLSPIAPALTVLYARSKELANEVSAMQGPSFNDLVTRFEDIDEEIARLTGPLHHQFGTRRKDWPNIKEISDACDELGSEHGSFMIAHKGLYEAHVRFRNSIAFEALANDEKHLIESAIEAWEREGVALSNDAQGRVAEIRAKLTKLGSDFQDNVTHATDGWEKYFPDAEPLKGLLPVHLDMLAAHAATKGESGRRGGYLLSLQPAHYMTVLEYAESDTLREEVWKAYASRASNIGPNAGQWDNGENAISMLALKKELSELLGFSSVNAYSIDDKMVKGIGVSGVEAFQASVASAARTKAMSEWAELEVFAREELGATHLEVWDIARASRLLREARFQVDEEEVRKYFPLKLIWSGLAERLNFLFGVTFVRVEAPLPHPDAEFYEVRNEAGDVIAGFYADLFSREGKRGGAWMDRCMYRRETADGMQLPVAYLCGNFRPPLPGKDAYLDQDELITLFHEAGHVFHHLLGRTRYIGTGMEHVEWDAVELPSQYLEEWCYDKETLLSMSAHENTGEKVPLSIIDALKRLRHFGAGLMYARQSVFGIFDWRAHKEIPKTPEELYALYIKTHNEFNVFPANASVRVPASFMHIFGGGYSAGYFSYLWAEGLVADVDSAFKEASERGGESETRAMYHRYRDEVLAVGAERPISDSFRIFRGRDLDPEKLIEHLGLV